jgi:hypothetical protein
VSFWHILNEAAVANICEVDEDIVANWLLLVLFCMDVVVVVDFFCFLLSSAEQLVLVKEEEDVPAEDEVDEVVGEVEYNLKESPIKFIPS